MMYSRFGLIIFIKALWLLDPNWALGKKTNGKLSQRLYFISNFTEPLNKKDYYFVYLGVSIHFYLLSTG